MKDWRTEERVYEVHEVRRKFHEVYTMICTGSKMVEWCRTKYEMNGYIPEFGGDKEYACWAVQMEY